MDETFEGRFAQAQLLWGNIAARPMRAFLNILAITIQVFLVLMIVGLTTGVVSEWGKRVEGVGDEDHVLDVPDLEEGGRGCQRLPGRVTRDLPQDVAVGQVLDTCTCARRASCTTAHSSADILPNRSKSTPLQTFAASI